MNLKIEGGMNERRGEIDGMTRYLFKRIGDGHGRIGADRLEKTIYYLTVICLRHPIMSPDRFELHINTTGAFFKFNLSFEWPGYVLCRQIRIYSRLHQNIVQSLVCLRHPVFIVQ